MKIKGLQKQTVLDYPGKLACTIFTFGCNFKCGFCHNPELIVDDGRPEISKDYVLKFLEERKGFLDGVCFSIAGNEPVIIKQNNLIKNVKIEDLWNKDEKLISYHNYESQSCKNLEALTIDQKFLPVKRIIRHKAKSIYKISFSPCNYEILATGNHSVFVLTKNGLKIKKVSELKNDYLVTPKQIKIENCINEIRIVDFLKEKLSKHKEEMLLRKKHWENIITDIIKNRINFLKASKKYKQSWDTIKRYVDAYKNSKLEEACYTARPNLLWLNNDILYVGYNKIMAIRMPITRELAELLGYAAAEGSYDGNSYRFTLGNEPQLAKRIIKLFRTVFKKSSGTILTKTTNGKKQYAVIIGGRYLGFLISKLVGNGAINKQVPYIIFNTSKENQRAFILALNKGDGHNRTRIDYSCEEFSIKTISRKLAADIIVLLKFFGIQALLSIEKAKGKNRASYKIHFHGNQFNKFNLQKKLKYKYSFLTNIEGIPKELLGMENLIKFKDQERICPRMIPIKYQTLDIFKIAKKWNILKVKRIKKISVKEYVYDLVVSKDNSFIGGLGPILLHNTGGEPTLNEDLPDFISKIKELGLLVKLDTNGTNPKMLEALINKKLVDYIAMDIKAPLEFYDKITNVKVNKDDIQKSVDLIRKTKNYEFRTTVVPGLFNEEHAKMIGEWLKGSNKFYIQQFRGIKTLDKSFVGKKPFSKEETIKFCGILKPYFETCEIRGIQSS